MLSLYRFILYNLMKKLKKMIKMLINILSLIFDIFLIIITFFSFVLRYITISRSKNPNIEILIENLQAYKEETQNLKIKIGNIGTIIAYSPRLFIESSFFDGRLNIKLDKDLIGINEYINKNIKIPFTFSDNNKIILIILIKSGLFIKKNYEFRKEFLLNKIELHQKF